MARHHRPAGYQDGRDIEPRRRHQHTGDDFVTVRDEDKAVELVRVCKGLDRVGNQLAGSKRILHADMAHRDAVTDTDCGDEHRRAARHADTGLDRVGNFIQVDVPRDNFAIGRNHADHRAGKLLIGVAAGAQQRTVWHTLRAFYDIVTSSGHWKSLLKI